MADLTLRVGGMTCAQCERNIERALAASPAVERCVASSRTGWVSLSLAGQGSQPAAQPGPELLADLEQRIRDAGYTPLPAKPCWVDAVSLVAIAAALVLLLEASGATRVLQGFPLAEEGMGFLGFFAVGLLTSVHCLSMCGGLAMIGVAGTRSAAASSAAYNLGRLASYAAIGALLGAVGQVLALGTAVRAALGVAVSVLMVAVGAGLTGYLPLATRLQLHLPSGLRERLMRHTGGRPVLVGLVNGLMPCGPLQTMQLLAITSGSALLGALDMAAFCLGTIPLMLVFGFFAGKLTAASRRIVAVAGGFLVMVFGFYLLLNNLALSGVSTPQLQENQVATAIVAMDGSAQEVETVLQAGAYPDIHVREGVPATWTIHADEAQLNGCNGELVVPAYGIRQKLHPGDNVIAFTPQAQGEVPYSCWMGMIKARIVVDG